jgi:SOS-response transcriptional repressor LexA
MLRRGIASAMTPSIHPSSNLLFRGRPNPAARAKLAHEVTVAQCLRTQCGSADPGALEETLNVMEQCHVASIRCDIAHRQGVFYPDCLSLLEMCDNTPMSDGFDIQSFQARLQALLDDKGVKAKRASIDAGLGETAIRDIMEAKRHDVRTGTLMRLAAYFGLTVDELISDRRMRLSGNVGAGGEVLFDPIPQHEAPLVPRPAGDIENVMALRVSGYSMLPKYDDGDIVYVRRQHDGIQPTALGEHCVVRTAEGGTFLKILAKGSRQGAFTLRSLNAPDMEDQEVLWAAPVIWVRPTTKAN